jgi:hypothetical protein
MSTCKTKATKMIVEEPNQIRSDSTTEKDKRK